MCKKEFSKIEEKENGKDKKIREHDHYTGKYRGASCQSCNLKEGKSSKIIPVFFHNGSNYDFHFIIEELMKYEDDYNKVTVLAKNSEEYISMEYGTSFKKLRFLDSYRFLGKGLSDITKSLTEFHILEKEFENHEIDEEELEEIKEEELKKLKEKFKSDFKIIENKFEEEEEKIKKKYKEGERKKVEKEKYKSDLRDLKKDKSEEEEKFKKEYRVEREKIRNAKHSLLKQKGVYPYEYIDSIEKLKENNLPRRKYWFSTLKQESISKKEYEHAHNVWNVYNCKTIKDYHNLYLKTDVLLLADAFEQFRDFFLKEHQIDPCYCFSAPGLTWQCGLKYTGIKLELLTDPDMLLMCEQGIRGGFSGVLGPRHVKTFNKYTSNYRKGERILDDREALECIKILKEGGDLNDYMKESFLLYLDANNLYGWAMSQKLPTGDFRWEEREDYYNNIPEGRGCLVECNLEYTDECKRKTMRYPLAPEHMVATKEMLSDYQLNLLEEQGAKLGTVKKLFLTLNDKKNYIIHHSILKEYIRLGLKVTKVHRTISFKESAWLKPYIDFNTQQRTKAKTLFEKDLWKLMNNSFYGKTMENIRNRSEIKLLSNEEKIIKYISKPNFKDSIIFNENLVAVVNNVTSIKFNKPIYLGQAILDYSKQLMYNFYYEIANKLWPDNEIVFGDTDSLVLKVASKDVYEDLEKIKEELDTSDYPEDHFLHSKENKKVIGKFKDELNGKIMEEIVCLRSKAYSYAVKGSEETKKLKGINKVVVDNDIKFTDYLTCLYGDRKYLHKMYRLNSTHHEMHISEVNKVSLNPFDDKRYIFLDKKSTRPHGYNEEIVYNDIIKRIIDNKKIDIYYDDIEEAYKLRKVFI